MFYHEILPIMLGSILGNLIWDRAKVAFVERQKTETETYRHSWKCPDLQCKMTVKSTSKKSVESIASDHMERFHGIENYKEFK